MFTGIIETVGRVKNIIQDRSNMLIWIQSDFSSELKIDQSVAHNGVCLTVTEVEGDAYSVSAIDETLKRSNLGELEIGDPVNLERGIKVGDRLDGHIVQGHVDTTAICTSIRNEDGSWIFKFEYDAAKDFITIPKGSITINGVSLTVVDSEEDSFSVAIIPFTYEHTTFNSLKENDRVNLEFDVIGKYVARLYANQN